MDLGVPWAVDENGTLHVAVGDAVVVALEVGPLIQLAFLGVGVAAEKKKSLKKRVSKHGA